jgi:flagellar motility protein MotE (MotC chaperone)
MSNNKQNKQALAKAAKTAAVRSPVKPGPAAEKTAAAQPFALRFRLLPVVIFAAVLLLGVRVVDLWQLVASRNASPPDVAATLAKDAQPMAAVGDGKTGAPLQPPGRLQLAQANTGTPAKEPAPANGEKKPEGDPTAGGDALSPINNEQLLKHYADRRAELEKSAKDVAMREALLSAAEKRIEQKLKEMEKVRTEIQNLLKMGDERQSQQLDSLVKIYETMKPKEAARIFEELEMPVLLDVIQKMKETKTAPILAAMDPMKAKQVTAALVERRILPAVPQ